LERPGYNYKLLNHINNKRFPSSTWTDVKKPYLPLSRFPIIAIFQVCQTVRYFMK
jgi:hypothetical protein